MKKNRPYDLNFVAEQSRKHSKKIIPKASNPYGVKKKYLKKKQREWEIKYGKLY